MAPKIIKLGLRDKYFDLLKEGKKIADGRLFKLKDKKTYNEKYDGLEYGDILEYYKDSANGKRTDEKYRVKINNIHYFDSPTEMIKELKLKNILPGIRTIKQGEEIYDEIYGEKLDGGVLIGFTFEKASNNNVQNVEKKKMRLVLKSKPVERVINEVIEITNKSETPKTHELYIKEPWMTLIRAGLKEVEGRLYKGDFAGYRIGDKINFVHKTREGKMENLLVKIVKLVKYPDFRSLLFHEKLFRVLPGFPSIRTGNELYLKYYPFKVIKENGALAITFEMIGKSEKNENKEIISSMKKNEDVPVIVDINAQVLLNENQKIVNEEQKKINKSLKNNKVEKLIEVNTKMINKNINSIGKKINELESAEIASSQIAVNINQNKINKEQKKVVKLKGKKKN